MPPSLLRNPLKQKVILYNPMCLIMLSIGFRLAVKPKGEIDCNFSIPGCSVTVSVAAVGLVCIIVLAVVLWRHQKPVAL